MRTALYVFMIYLQTLEGDTHTKLFTAVAGGPKASLHGEFNLLWTFTVLS